MSFNKNKYKVLRECISKDLTDFLHEYILLKEKVFKIMRRDRYISEFNLDWGGTDDHQMKDCYVHYGDIACETLLAKLKPIFEKEAETKLVENYTYGRVYNKGKKLERHKDRMSCEISATLNLGGDPWPIYLEPNHLKGFIDLKNKYHSEYTKGVEIILKPGDLLMYRGCDLEHWRDVFKGKMCNQVFLHYNNIETSKKLNVKFDGRESLGLPPPFKKK